MFDSFRKNEPTLLDLTINRLLAEMETFGPETPEYEALVTRLERLHKVKAETHKPKFSSDTLLIVGGNLLGILLIVAYEQNHVMVSKAMSYIPTLKAK